MTPPAQSQQPFQDLLNTWRDSLISGRLRTKHDDPSYFYNEPRCLITQANVKGFALGIGDEIISALLPAIEAAESEVIFITCFWAKSSSLKKLGASLRTLSEKAISRGTTIRVHIGLSSISLFQKLFQTSNLSGKVYQPSELNTKLALPSPAELGGLDLEVKSVFVRPFSVMHPKFVIIDRKEVWLPSCNVSWETWLEGYVVMGGPIVSQFVSFWQHFWARTLKSYEGVYENLTTEDVGQAKDPFPRKFPHSSDYPVNFTLQSIQTVFLPSPHHRNPRFSLPWQPHRSPPPTPLNEFLLVQLSSAKSSILIQTPNLTSPPVLAALLGALERGVNVNIVTCERLMILEQLVTAGRTTAQCVKTLVKRYKRLKSTTEAFDEETALQQPGKLVVQYFQPKQATATAKQTHLKLTIVDDEWVVLGSGNLDRASWYTSQELGVAFHSDHFAQGIKRVLNGRLAHQLKDVYQS
jgi:phosphatidylserine/phosphatidylglycerophosphate/cardiolipin synthase-like enzyme